MTRLPRPRELALTHRKEDIHRVLADDRRQRAALRADDVSLRDRRTTDFSGNRRGDFGVTQVYRRGVQICFIDQRLGVSSTIRRQCLIARRNGTSARLHQLIGSLILDCRQQLFCLARYQGSLRLVDSGLKQILFESIEGLPFLDNLALLEQYIFEISGNPRVNLHALDGLDPPDEVNCLRDGLSLGGDRPYRYCASSGLLRQSRSGEPADQDGSCDRNAHRGFLLRQGGPAGCRRGAINRQLRRWPNWSAIGCDCRGYCAHPYTGVVSK